MLLNTLAIPAGAEAAAQNAATLPLDVMWRAVMIWGGVGLILLVPISS